MVSEGEQRLLRGGVDRVRGSQPTEIVGVGQVRVLGRGGCPQNPLRTGACLGERLPALVRERPGRQAAPSSALSVEPGGRRAARRVTCRAQVVRPSRPGRRMSSGAPGPTSMREPNMPDAASKPALASVQGRVGVERVVLPGGPGESAGCHGLTSLAALLDRLASAAPGHRLRCGASGSPWVCVQCRDRARLSASGAN